MIENNKEELVQKQEPKPYNVYFIADTHIGHKNILFHQPNRVKDLNLKSADDVEGMNEYIYEMWDDTLKRGDHVYLLGDVFLGGRVGAWKCIQRLKRKGVNIHLIVGNHDKNIPKFTSQFASIDYIKLVTFKKSVFPFLDEETDDLMVNAGFDAPLAHYKLISLEQVWRYFKNKRGDLSALKYVNKIRNENPKFVG